MRFYRLASACGVLTVGAGVIIAAAPPAAASAPTISAFKPTSGTIGTRVALIGSGFARVSRVAFNGAASTFAVKSYTEIIATVPAAASTGRITVTAWGVTGQSSAPFTVTPGISLSRTSGPPTSSVTVAGAGFAALEGIGVYFDGGVDLTPQLSTNLTGNFGPVTINVPASAAPGTHVIIAKGLVSGKSALKDFTVSTDWPTYGFSNQHSGYNPYENVLGPGNVGRLSQHWSLPTGGRASPVEVNGVIYAGSEDGNVYAVSAATGAGLWTFATGGGLTSPAVANGVLYVGSEDGNVYALNATTGAELWTFTAGTYVASSPTVANGVVYVASSPNADNLYATLYALNASTGTELWSVNEGHIINTSPTVANGVVYLGTDDGLHALNAATGAALWSFTTGYFATGSPVVANGLVFISLDDDNLYALNAATGAELWSVAAGTFTPFFDPVAANGVVFVGCEDNNLYALNAFTGSQLWHFTAGSYIGSAAVANGVVYAGSGDGNLYAIDAFTGARLWNFTFSSNDGLYTSPVVANAGVYIGFDSHVYAFAIPPGLAI